MSCKNGKIERARGFARTPVAIFLSGLLCSGIVSAYESENAVPLTVGAAALQVDVEGIEIRLRGRDVTLSTKLYNATKAPQIAAFYAYTPLFHQLGDGEDYLDKTFSDLRVTVRGQPKRTEKYVRAYFLGQDITERLVKAGIDLMPSVETPYAKLKRIPKVEGQVPADWEAFITYAWVDRMVPGERSTHDVAYRDMPQFGFEDLTSDRLSQRVLQYCGNPDEVRKRIRQADPDAQQVIVEGHEFPVPYMGLREVTLEARPPEKNWLGGRPLISLVCGIKSAEVGAEIQGTLSAADPTIYLMTISLISPVPK